MTTRTTLPWYIKILLKIILARIPLSHATWYKLGIFKHGKMQDFSYARGVFTYHLARADLLEKEKNIDKVVMELGPGESLFFALLAKSYCFKRSLLLDVDDFTLPDVDGYQRFSRWLANEGLPCPSINDCSSIDSMLAVCDSQFLIDGLNSLRKLPDDSVDFIFSHTVLQHIRKNEFIETSKELWRVLKPGGLSTHVVDFHDTIEESINNLRFSDRLWETEWMASSGFYTNRLRLAEMIRIFEDQAFKVDVLEKQEWPAIPIPKKRLNTRFMSMTDAELKISGATLRLYKHIL
jgi:SAM-dependent methyltransferase